ncbi:hypothetical protein [Mesorhizobium metallidurans]|uniref:hypothetical protein n=1 Tax=Mesorhizobium metallidurans TaxID=489722 RepID=UPI00058E39CD|nr:hypothetical protein [Mesorhizobium metallidurans]
MKRFALTISMLAGLVACATPPDKIAGVPNAGPCTQADRERLAIVTNQQNKAVTGDALGVFLIGVPVSSMSGGDHETEIAILKGRCGAPKT